MLQYQLFCVCLQRSSGVFSPNYFLRLSRNTLNYQFRGIRHKAKGFGSSTTSDNKSSNREENKKDGNKKDEISEDKELEESLEKTFQKFGEIFGKVPAPKEIKEQVNSEEFKEFVFGKFRGIRHKAQGFGSSSTSDKKSTNIQNLQEREDPLKDPKFILFLLFALFAPLIMFYGPLHGMSKEHQQIFKTKNTINFHQFVKVQEIYFYPFFMKAIAILHPNYTGESVSTNGIPISVPMELIRESKFNQAIRNAELNLGVDEKENIPIIHKTLPVWLFILISYLMMCMLQYTARRMLSKRNN